MTSSGSDVEFGIDTFGGITKGADGRPLHHAEVVRNIVEEGVVADEVGLDFIGIGEHHRRDFAVSSPEMVLAAIAARTERIRLGSAVTVLSSDDPVRVFERFSTLDAVSNGRAEIVVGRGSFTESFPLFGLDLARYEELFEDRLGLFAEIVEERPVTWSGTTRASLTSTSIYPPTERGLTVWVGVGASPESVVRAARYHFGLFLAIIGGAPERFRSYVDLFERAQDEFGVERRPVAVHSPGFVGATDDEAYEAVFDGWVEMRTRIGAERGWPPPTSGDFEREIEHGSLYVGSPETVARKVARTITALGVDRFDLKYDSGSSSHEAMLGSIELFGRKVVPMVKDILSS